MQDYVWLLHSRNWRRERIRKLECKRTSVMSDIRVARQDIGEIEKAIADYDQGKKAKYYRWAVNPN